MIAQAPQCSDAELVFCSSDSRYPQGGVPLALIATLADHFTPTKSQEQDSVCAPVLRKKSTHAKCFVDLGLRHNWG